MHTTRHYNNHPVRSSGTIIVPDDRTGISGFSGFLDRECQQTVFALPGFTRIADGFDETAFRLLYHIRLSVHRHFRKYFQ